MNEEINKFCTYLDEVYANWETKAELVLSKQFFEIWESMHKPVAFKLTDSQVQLQHAILDELPTNGIAWFAWHDDEESPALFVETKQQTIVYPIVLLENQFDLSPAHTIRSEEEESDIGKRLEFIQDVIHHIIETSPRINIFQLGKEAYVKAVRALASEYPKDFIHDMLRRKIKDVQDLIRQATQDMAQDEISNQLTLPLDGTFSFSSRTSLARQDMDVDLNIVMSQPRSKWTIEEDFHFLIKANEQLQQIDHELTLSFENAKLISRDPLLVQVPVQEELARFNGDEFLLFKPGQKAPVGTFEVKINDKKNLIGKISWQESDSEFTSSIIARRRTGNSRYLMNLLQHQLTMIQQGSQDSSDSFNACIGLNPISLNTAEVTPPDTLDPSQQRAWQTAVNFSNPLVLIQGPPGTGKTHVIKSIIEYAMKEGQRVLITAPSNTAVDNICSRILHLPLLRVGSDPDRIAPKVLAKNWLGDLRSVHNFQQNRKEKECVYAGTYVGLLREQLLQTELENNGHFDLIIFDEAGMGRLEEVLLCMQFAKRAVLVGDHQQLPPFPLPTSVMEQLESELPCPHYRKSMLQFSILQWLIEIRRLPAFMLQSSYRCQSPRLMRFSSTMFYNAQVKSSRLAEYFQLPFDERSKKYPTASLSFFSTSGLPEKKRSEVFQSGAAPGFESPTEAKIVAQLVLELIERIPLLEITVITPYRRQLKLVRNQVSRENIETKIGKVPDADWNHFLHKNIATVDSFQGDESDAVIISYVRSNKHGSIGFVDDKNRINVAHTRCRKEMFIVGDLDFLKQNADSDIFHRMERAILRDGEVIDIAENKKRFL